MQGITKKQLDFCVHFVHCGNQSAAYRHAYDCSKMKPNTIHRKAHDLMRVDKVAARIAELHQQELDLTAETYRVEKDLVIREYLRLAFADVRKLFNSDGTIHDVDQIDDDTAAAIGSIELLDSGISMDKNGRPRKSVTTKVKMLDKRQPLQDLAKMLGLFEKDNLQRKDEIKNLSLSVNFVESKKSKKITAQVGCEVKRIPDLFKRAVKR